MHVCRLLRQRLLTAGALLLALSWTVAAPLPTPARAWWDDFPTIVQTGDAAQAERGSAVASLCGAADDPCWGIFAQKVRQVSFPGRVDALHKTGLRALTWIEGFGTAEAYIVQVKRDAHGAWLRYPDAPDLTRIWCNAWGWKSFDGTGEVRWVGIHNYFDPEDFVQPYTREHPRYGCPAMTYPDGRTASGYQQGPEAPWTHRVYAAGGAKNVLGRVHFENAELNATAGTEPEAMLAAVPDPGYTPEQWAQLRAERLRTRKTLQVSVGKDSACPVWIDYAQASIRQALDLGVDGLWVDNFSPWDSFNANPVDKAFGEWSVAGFRAFLAGLSTTQREPMGLADSAGFDVRPYLLERCRAWGGEPTDLRHPAWRDPRWLDDPVWRAYLIYKRQTGSAALSRLYGVAKQEALAAGRPEFAVLGNDIPLFSLGWVRGDLDMVSTELTWGWSLSGGARGLMPPPLGSYVPLYKLAREHARSRFVNLWQYVPDECLGKEGIAAVLYYQGLATHALPMPNYPHQRDAGTESVDAAFFRFVRASAALWGARLPVETIGLYYSSSSQLAAMTPAGTLDFNAQTHAFAFWGWGTALTWQHAPWRALPEWKVNAAELAGLKVLVVPSAGVFPAEDVPVLERWVEAGGRLILAGTCGVRRGEHGLFERLATGSTLSPLTRGTAAGLPMRLGKGSVQVVSPDPGLEFYAADSGRPALLPAFAALAGGDPDNTAGPQVTAPGVPWNVGLTLYHDPAARRLFVDLNNTAIDLATDVITPTAALSFQVTVPAAWGNAPVSGRLLGPAPMPHLRLRPTGPGEVEVEVGPVSLYACLVLEAGSAPESPMGGAR
jgi:hypothetical protein